MNLRSRALLLALGALVAAPAADAAAAKPIPGAPQLETFKVTIRGSQVSTWSLREVDNPDDPCDSPASGDGSQMVRFFSRPTKITVLRDGAEAIVGQSITAPLSVEREGEARSAGSSADCPSVAIGDADLAPLTQPDCGKRTGKVDLRLQFGEARAEDDFLVPLVSKNTVSLTGDFREGLTYDDCPWWMAGGDAPSDDAISPAAEKFTIKNLFNKRRKVLKASTDLTRNYTGPGFTGKTLLTWNLKMVRVK